MGNWQNPPLPSDLKPPLEILGPDTVKSNLISSVSAPFVGFLVQMKSLEFAFEIKGGFKSEGRGGFSQLPKMSADKTIPGFKKWKCLCLFDLNTF